MKVSVIGASGVLGRHLIPLLVQAGHTVFAGARNIEKMHLPEFDGATVFVADILNPRSLQDAVAGCDAAIHIATAVPPPGVAMEWGPNDEVRRDGTANLIQACVENGVSRLVVQSIAMLHKVDDQRPQREEAPIAGAGVLASAIDMEKLVEASGLDWRTVRGALFYGPGTGREESWFASAKANQLVVPGDGSDWVCMLHVADMASAMVAVLETPEGHRAYIATDEAPLTYQTLFSGIAERAGAKPVETDGPAMLPSFRVSNARLRALGWKPAYSDFWTGIADFSS